MTREVEEEEEDGEEGMVKQAEGKVVCCVIFEEKWAEGEVGERIWIEKWWKKNSRKYIAPVILKHLREC